MGPVLWAQDYDCNATASESKDDRIGAEKVDGQSDCEYGEGGPFFPDFFDPYFYFTRVSWAPLWGGLEH